VVHPGANWSTADVHRGWVRGLEAHGVQVDTFDLQARLMFYSKAQIVEPDGSVSKVLDEQEVMHAASHGVLAAVYATWPDLVLVVTGSYSPPYLWELIRSRGHKVVIVHTESPYEDERQLVIAAESGADINLINDPTHLAQFEQVGPSFYVPHAYDPAVHFPADIAPVWDCSFVGTGFPERVRFLERVDWSGIRFGLGGLWELEPGSPLRDCLFHADPLGCVDNDVTADLYRATKVGLNVYRESNDGGYSTGDGWACGPREIELAACGTMFARQSRPESDELFPFLPVFEDPAEVGDIVRHYMGRDGLRAVLGARARAAVADRTFEVHAGRLLGRLGF
jgi:spore maturation protein CgeB